MQVHGEGVLLFNVLMDAVCIVSAGRFLQLSMRPGNVLLASLLGGIYALLALWQQAFSGLAALLISSLCMAAIAFPRHVIKGTGGIWLVGLCGNGVVQTLSGIGLDGMAASACALCFMLTFCVMGKTQQRTLRGVMRLEWNGRRVHIPVMVDTGNLLREKESGLPVVVVPRHLCDGLDTNPGALSYLSVQTASGRAELPYFLPDRCTVRLLGRGELDLLAAVALTEEHLPLGLFPYAALQKTRIKEACHADTGYGP